MTNFPQQLSGYVTEIGSAFLCAELGITQDVRPDHAQYLANWLQLLKGDPNAIFVAAARASEAVSRLLFVRNKNGASRASAALTAGLYPLEPMRTPALSATIPPSRDACASVSQTPSVPLQSQQAGR